MNSVIGTELHTEDALLTVAQSLQSLLASYRPSLPLSMTLLIHHLGEAVPRCIPVSPAVRGEGRTYELRVL